LGAKIKEGNTESHVSSKREGRDSNAGETAQKLQSTSLQSEEELSTTFKKA